MKVSLPSEENFRVQDVLVAGEECVLITPKKGKVVWTEENKFFRSSIWRKSDMHPISLGYRKFTDLGGQLEFESIDGYEDLEFVRKMDGSLAILSFWKGEIIFRTRGKADTSTLKNGPEVELLKQKYPKVFALKDPTHSLLFEWTTPSNRIVLKETEEPTLWLTGIVRHSDYSYFEQRELDQVARELEVPRPERFFLDMKNLTNFLEEKNNSIEGVVIYANKGQILKKAKTLKYLTQHAVFTGIKSLKGLVELWVILGHPEILEFKKQIQQKYDSQLLIDLEPLINELEQKYEGIKARLEDIEKYVLSLKNTNLNRKDLAELIKNEMAPPWQKIAFAMLSSKNHIKMQDLILNY